MIVNGRVVLDSEIWVNLLTPERAAEMNRAYDEKRRIERRRIDAKFARSASSPKKIYRNRPAQVTYPTNLRKRALAEQAELLELQLNQERLLHFILE